MSGFWERRLQLFQEWWRKPIKWWDRALICAATFFYFGIIASVIGLLFGGVPLLPLNVLLIGLAKWGMTAAIFGGVLGYLFPKVMLCIIYPLTFFSFDANVS